ncbi:methionine aminopeptidase 1A-like [Salvia miltiorrhiza]|uniref:methionine aminopeptidase 1A-like n=1 Tax=Salvia miltiorrhiza TaxID=226208 RepID=UPI0025AD21C0|nr:methionine aminopeptidase 1A-like [Salvia miltiorrhiza]XP_057806733.1 methionine aminopeptidase 1A-like [Salvia miltiorrhiza]
MLISVSDFAAGYFGEEQERDLQVQAILEKNRCPKCVELKLRREGAAFCSQECFKASWSSHKSVHLNAKSSLIASESYSEQNLGLPGDGWLYCLIEGQAQTPKLPHFDWF